MICRKTPISAAGGALPIIIVASRADWTSAVDLRRASDPRIERVADRLGRSALIDQRQRDARVSGSLYPMTLSYACGIVQDRLRWSQVFSKTPALDTTKVYWCTQPRARSFTLVSAPRIHSPRETAARRSRCPHHRDRSGAPSDWSRIARLDRAGLLEQRAVARNDAIRALFKGYPPREPKNL